MTIPGCFYIYREQTTGREALCLAMDSKPDDKECDVYIVAGDSPYSPPIGMIRKLRKHRLFATIEFPLTIYERMKERFMEESRVYLEGTKNTKTGIAFCMHNFNQYSKPVTFQGILDDAKLLHEKIVTLPPKIDVLFDSLDKLRKTSQECIAPIHEDNYKEHLGELKSGVINGDVAKIEAAFEVLHKITEERAEIYKRAEELRQEYLALSGELDKAREEFKCLTEI